MFISSVCALDTIGPDSVVFRASSCWFWFPYHWKRLPICWVWIC